MPSLKKVYLDTRDLEHPLPLEHAIKALRALDEESYLYMVHRKNPIPLLDLSSEQGFQVLSKEDNEALWHILIAKNSDIDLNELVDV